jgi:hypothetical protein
MSRKPLSIVLLVAVLVLVVLATVTLLPSSAPMKSDLGYPALCPFAPWSTLALLLLAGLSWVVRGHINAQTD